MLLKPYATSTIVYFPLIDRGEIDFDDTPVTFATGDTQVSSDGAAFANTTNNPTHVGNGVYALTLTAAEMTGADLCVTVIDQTNPKSWEDQCIIFQTYGAANADIPFNFNSTASVTTVNPLSSDGSQLTLVQGDDYIDSIGRAITWSSTAWLDLTSATAVTFETWNKRDRGKKFSKAMTATATGGATQTVQLELTSSETIGLRPSVDEYAFRVVATIGGGTVTLVGNNAYLTVIDIPG